MLEQGEDALEAIFPFIAVALAAVVTPVRFCASSKEIYESLLYEVISGGRLHDGYLTMCVTVRFCLPRGWNDGGRNY